MSAADVVWFGPSTRCSGALRASARRTTTHNARHYRDPDSQCLFASVPKLRAALIVNQAILGGIRRRRRFRRPLHKGTLNSQRFD